MTKDGKPSDFGWVNIYLFKSLSYMTQIFLLFIIFVFCYIVLYGIELIRDRWLIGSLTGAVVFDKVAKYIQRYLYILIISFYRLNCLRIEILTEKS